MSINPAELKPGTIIEVGGFERLVLKNGLTQVIGPARNEGRQGREDEPAPRIIDRPHRPTDKLFVDEDRRLSGKAANVLRGLVNITVVGTTAGALALALVTGVEAADQYAQTIHAGTDLTTEVIEGYPQSPIQIALDNIQTIREAGLDFFISGGSDG